MIRQSADGMAWDKGRWVGRSRDFQNVAGGWGSLLARRRGCWLPPHPLRPFPRTPIIVSILDNRISNIQYLKSLVPYPVLLNRGYFPFRQFPPAQIFQTLGSRSCLYSNYCKYPISGVSFGNGRYESRYCILCLGYRGGSEVSGEKSYARIGGERDVGRI